MPAAETGGEPVVSEDDHRVLADRYRLTDSIGRGGMADVYSAEDTHSGRLVAVKVLRVGDTADPDRFAAEMAILDRLAHPAIVRLFDTGRTADDSPYFVMQLVQGESLSTRLRDEGPLDEDAVVKVAARIAGALSHAHDRGVVHRDIKPANILIDDRGRGYLTDFGVARLVDSTLVTRAGTTIGTAAYLAPEQLQDSAVGPEADIYSLGLVLIEAFTGERAFRGRGIEAAMARLTCDPAMPEDLPDNWLGLLLAMTRREPARRPDAEFVEGVLRGRLPPPPLDPEELAARDREAMPSDELPTAVSPPAGAASGSGQWEPPSEDSGARNLTPSPPPPTPPPGAEGVPVIGAGSAVPQPSRPRRAWVLVSAAVAGVLAVVLAITAAVVLTTGFLDGRADAPAQVAITGDDPVDEAAAEVLRVIDASETLRTSDPALQRRLRLLSRELAESINADRWEGAIRATVDMTAEVDRGIEQLDIDQVTFRPLLDALSQVTRQIQMEIEADRGGTN